jgi:hypothetical protein
MVMIKIFKKLFYPNYDDVDTCYKAGWINCTRMLFIVIQNRQMKEPEGSDKYLIYKELLSELEELFIKPNSLEKNQKELW